MKNFVLAGVSAKYIHTSLAVRSLAAFARGRGVPLTTAEFTINQRADFILAELFRLAPDALFFSCYLWNIDLILQVCPSLKKILPNCKIFFGGPEVSYNPEELLSANGWLVGVLRGEGELTFAELLRTLEDGGALTTVDGLTFRGESGIVCTPNRQLLDLALLPFPYEEGFDGLRNQIIYYEASRGCPYCCSYCLSSVGKGVRFVPLPKVFADLQRFLDGKVRQVKFVDRTFNCNRERTMAVWEYLAAHDNGVTNFHFELTADLLDAEMLHFLRPLRSGLFQFEIGVQSTNPQTIAAINRKVDFATLAAIVRGVKQGGNIHQHLDLIAGLPFEDYRSFANSFNDVYALAPEQLQLGFLKVLKGSPIHRQCGDFGISYRNAPPYEVLFTKWLSYAEVLQLCGVEEMVELFYNSARFIHSTAYLAGLFPTPFDFYESLSAFWLDAGHHHKSHAPQELCTILYTFAQGVDSIDLQRWMWLIKLDLCLHEHPKKPPTWLTVDYNTEYRQRMLDFYSNPQNLARYLPQYLNYDCRAIYKLAHIEVFGAQRQAVLFNYDRRDLAGNALCHEIML